MVAKMKSKFIPKDYQITLFWRMQNLRQKLMSVKEYTEEFYKINIRVGHRESDDEKVARYINGLQYDNQDEMNMMTLQTVEDAIEEHLFRAVARIGARSKMDIPVYEGNLDVDP